MKSGSARCLLPALAAALIALGLASCSQGLALSSLLTPTQTLTPTSTGTITALPTATLTPSPLPLSPTAGPTHTREASDTPSLTPTPSDTVTPGPSPTPSRTGTPTRTPTRTRIPTRTRTPSRTPTITLTPTVTNTPTPPAPRLEIARPGLLSRVLSPISAEIYAIPGDDGLVRVELLGEDGRTLYRKDTDYSNYRGRSIAFYPDIPYEIQAMAETGRLQVSTYDRIGRPIGLMSVDLVLLSIGRAEIFAPEITQEPYIVRFPKEGQAVTGGALLISGLARPVNDLPLIFECIGEDGQVIASGQFHVDAPSGPLSHTPFLFEIPYQVGGPTPVRLTIRQEGSRIPGTLALSSMLLVLEP